MGHNVDRTPPSFAKQATQRVVDSNVAEEVEPQFKEPAFFWAQVAMCDSATVAGSVQVRIAQEGIACHLAHSATGVHVLAFVTVNTVESALRVGEQIAKSATDAHRQSLLSNAFPMSARRR